MVTRTARQKFETEFGQLDACQHIYYEMGHGSGVLGDTAAATANKMRLGVVSALVCSLDDTYRLADAQQMTLAGHLPDDSVDELTAGRCFQANLLAELDELVHWLAGYEDGYRARAGRPSAAEASSTTVGFL